MDKLTIKAFRASEEHGLCDEFVREHTQVLTDFGIPLSVAPDLSWTTDPSCWVIVAIHETLGMVGGVRLQVKNAGRALPMEETIAPMDERIANEIAIMQANGCGEICGLWNANRFKNKGVVVLLGVAVTAIATQADIRSLVCFIAHYTKRHSLRNGFVPIETLGESGSFQYPIAGIRSIAMVNPDSVLLPHASESVRHTIYSLRIRPNQIRLECPAEDWLEVAYDLAVVGNMIDLVAHGNKRDDEFSLTA